MGLTEILLAIVVVLITIVLIKQLGTKSSDAIGSKDEIIKSTQNLMMILQNQLNNVNNQQNEKLDRAVKELNDRLIEQNRALNDQLFKSSQSTAQQFQMSQKALNDYAEKIKGLTQEITKVGETGKDIKTFAQQLQNFENILKNPKQRGILGEYFLETVLKNVLPPDSFQMQYKFKNGDIVDAVVFVKDKIIPIDSKFSLENYNKILAEENPDVKVEYEKMFKNDLKKRIDETSKYIKPEEGTMDFAFMFIPSEGIYSDLLINEGGRVNLNSTDLINYAFSQKKVIIVSPTSFLAYLQTVLQGLRALKIEESAKNIRDNVIKLSKHLDAYQKNFDKLGKNLGTVVVAYNDAHKEFKKIDKDVLNISGETMEIISEEVDKPVILDLD